eukprot:XP_011431932.1 PREDICTED: uncharacterized protein LOC105331445 isoform X4 [Crassostrea gigas]
MASKTLSKDQQNFMWISIACVDFIKLPLKDILDNQIKPADLFNRINSSSTHRTYYLRREQENICFIPPPGQPDYNDFDVTLLYTLIRNLSSASLNPTSLNPTKGWGKVPDSSHMRIGDDIERLRLMRNKFAHANSAGIPEAEFQVLWNDLKSVIPRIQTFMNSTGSNVNYEQKLADIERTDFGFGDLQKYKLFLEATLSQLKEERIKDEPEISITGAERVVWGEKTCFEADLKQKEASHWSISWQRVRGSVTYQIDISDKKYRDSTRTQLVIHSVSKDDEGEYQAVLARESNGNKRKIESNAIFLHVKGELPGFKVWKVTTEEESITIHYKVKNNAPRVYDIKWIKNGEGLNFKTQKYVGGGLSDSFLRITSPNGGDKGTYSCTLENAVGFTSRDVTFDIPKATISTESKVYLGSTAQIKSEVSSTLPLSKYEWQKSVDGNAFECMDINERKYHGTCNFMNPLLLIQNTTFDDILYYRLLVWNRIGGCVSNTIYLNVTGNPPNITCSHETCFESRSVKLIAKVYLYDTCHAIQKVVWTVNDEEIDQRGLGGKFSEVSVDSPCLTIHNINCCDAGSYKITATNAVGSTTSDAIVLNIPEVIFAKFEKEDGTQWVTVTIKSIPEPVLVQWRKRERNSDRFQPINVNAEEFKGSSCSFPHPVLVVKLKEQVENFHFQIKIKNFIGTCKKTIQDLFNLVPGTMKSENVSSDEINDGSLNENYDDEVAGIKFAILFDDLADHFPEEKFKKLEDLIQSSTKVNNIESLKEAKSARDCFRILYSENLFTKLDVTFMQFLLRRTGCKELDNKCAEYAKGQKALGFYEKQTEDGFKHIYFHVTGDLSNFNKEKRRQIRETVAAMVGCKTDRVSLNGYRHSESFIAIVSIEVIYVGKLVAINEQDRYRFVRLNIDYFTVDFIKVILKISPDSQRVDYHEHVPKTEQHRILPPRVFVPSKVRVDTSTRFLHKMEDEESMETSLKSQRVDYQEHVQKTEQQTIVPPHESTFVPSKVTTTGFLHTDETIMKLLPESQRVDYHEHVQKTKQHRIIPPTESTLVPSKVRVDTSTRFLQKMADKGSMETSLKSQRVDYQEHVQKTEQQTIVPPHESTFVPSKVTTTGFLHTDETIMKLLPESQLVDYHEHVQKTEQQTIIPPYKSTFVPSKVTYSRFMQTDETIMRLFPELPIPKRFEYNARLRSSINVSTSNINHISCFKPNRLWLSTENIIKEIDEDGHLLRELSVNLTHAGYHTVSKAGGLLFKKDNDIYMLSSSGEIRNLHIHANELSCIHSSQLNGDIFVGEEELIERYNDKGVKLQTISTIKFTERSAFRCFKLVYPNFYCKITENINGDIVTIVNNQLVAFKSDGEHKFTYSGKRYGSNFNPSGLCNDTFGHILVRDFYHLCVHLLDINGYRLAKFLIHRPYPNAMCVDEKNNLYVGCVNTIDVYTYLSDTAITEHDAMVIDSDIP